MSRARRSLLALIGSLACGAASAANASGDYLQFRYFYPSSGLEGAQLEGQYSDRTPKFSVSLRATELSLQKRNVNVSVSSGGYFGYASANVDRFRQSATYTALAGYSAPTPGFFSDATLTYLRAEDWRPDQGYTLNSFSLDTRGQFSKDWRWNAAGSYDTTGLNLTPDAPASNRSLSLGLDGKWSALDIRARAHLGSSASGSAPSTLSWGATLDASAPITQTETLAANVTYSSPASAGSGGTDSESLALSSTRLAPLTLGAALTRSDHTFGARVNAQYAFSDALSLTGEYGLSLTDPLSQDGSLSVDFHNDAWTLSSGLDADLTPDINDALTFSVSPRISLTYTSKTFSASLRGNARYSPLPAATTLTTPTPLGPWSYHLDASAQTQGQPLTFALNLKADSATSSAPATGEAGVQALYALNDHWRLNASARYRALDDQPSVQGGLGVRYDF